MEARYQLRHSPVPGIASTSDRASEAPCRGDSSILHRPLSQMKSGGRLCDTNLMSWPLASAASGSITERWQFSNPLMPRKPLVSRPSIAVMRSEEHTSELQSRGHLVCRLLLEK